ncbi:MAG: hypothetical protein QG552_2329 [Thermodesulfobacteriota bacterium]|nr:hypothetical protein [Thermodesulfobacteriota bacterium]
MRPLTVAIKDKKMTHSLWIPETICYCFGYTTEDIQNDLLRHGRSTILEGIQKEKKAGGCNCAAKNPKGR